MISAGKFDPDFGVKWTAKTVEKKGKENAKQARELFAQGIRLKDMGVAVVVGPTTATPISLSRIPCANDFRACLAWSTGPRPSPRRSSRSTSPRSPGRTYRRRSRPSWLSGSRAPRWRECGRDIRGLSPPIRPECPMELRSARIVESDPERARDLMLEFAAYTRHSLARHGDYTTVAGEFAAIEAYLAPRPRGARGEAAGAGADRPGDPAGGGAVPRAAAVGGERRAARRRGDGARRARAGGGRGAGQRVRDHGRGRRPWHGPRLRRRRAGRARGGPGTSGWSTSTGGCGRCSAPATG